MDATDRFERAQELLATGDFESAVMEFRKLVLLAEDNESKISCLFAEILALIQLGKTEEARHVLGSARTLFGDIDEASARGDLIEIHIDSAEERWDRVLPALERLLKQYPEIRCLPQLQDVYEDVQTRRGMCLANIGRFSEALPLLEEATSFTTQPPPNDIYRELGRCYISIGDYDRASEMLTKAISGGLEEAGLAAAHYDLGTLLMRKKAYARALQNLELAEKYSQSTNASATWKQGLYKAIAICFHELGIDRGAKEYYKLIITS